MTLTPTWFLTAAYWLHMLATVIWVGGLAAITLIVLPAAQKSLDETTFLSFISRLTSRFQRLGWFCLVVLVGTGMFQMSAHPSYQGFLAITNNWSLAILTKHIIIGVMVLVSATLTWGVLPALERNAILAAAGKGQPEIQARLVKRSTQNLRVALLLSLVVLLLTAWARTAG